MSELTASRQAKDHFMKGDRHSPLTDEQQREFRGLSYYDENPDLRLELDLEQYEAQESIEIQTSTGEVTSLVRWGKLSFDVEGEAVDLTVYRDAEGSEFFLPFADATSGSETYGAGRYLDIEELGNGRVLVDFNYAYSPYCAYNEQWSCPLTPIENRIKVPIRAGEKNFK